MSPHFCHFSDSLPVLRLQLLLSLSPGLVCKALKIHLGRPALMPSSHIKQLLTSGFFVSHFPVPCIWIASRVPKPFACL